MAVTILQPEELLALGALGAAGLLGGGLAALDFGEVEVARPYSEAAVHHELLTGETLGACPARHFCILSSCILLVPSSY